MVIVDQIPGFTPIKVNSLSGGTQAVYRFANGFGASVVRHDFSYGSSEGLAELGVIKFKGGDEEYGLTYRTEITNDVLGYLDQEEVAAVLTRIEALPENAEELTLARKTVDEIADDNHSRKELIAEIRRLRALLGEE